MQFLPLLQQILILRLEHQGDGSRFLGLRSNPQLHATSHIDIRYMVLLAQHGDMADHIDWAHIGSQDHNTFLTLADCLYHVLDATAEFFLLV